MFLVPSLTLLLCLATPSPVVPGQDTAELDKTPPATELPAVQGGEDPKPKQQEAKPSPGRRGPKRIGGGVIRITPRPTPTPEVGQVEPTPSPEVLPAPQLEEADVTNGIDERPRSPFDRAEALIRRTQKDPFADLTPGVIPPQTDPAAMARWAKLIEASKDKASSDGTGPVTSFDLEFEVVHRDDKGSYNEAEARVRYLASMRGQPSYVRFQLEQGTELGVGPGGSFWSLDGEGRLRDISLRQYAQSKQRVQDVRTIAKNFLALAEPSNLRLVSLSAAINPPAVQPPNSAKRMEGLVWLTVDSPDFDLSAGTTATPKDQPPSGRLYRAYIGLGPSDSRVVEAMVVELRDGQPLHRTSTWITLGDHIGKNGISFPGSIKIRRPITGATPMRPTDFFTKKASDEFYLIKGTLRANLSPENFTGK